MLKTIEKLHRGERCVIVCAGDSLSEQNYHLNGYLNYVGHLSERLSAFRTARVINAGVSGENTGDFLLRWEHDVTRFRPDLLTVMFGINDSKKGAENLPEFRSNLLKIIQNCAQSGIELVLLTQNPLIEINTAKHSLFEIKRLPQDNSALAEAALATTWEDVLLRAAYPEYVRCLLEVSAQNSVPVCDIYGEWEKHMLEKPMDKWMLMSDPIHPNEYGHRFMAKTLLRFLQL